ncbi:chromaffin granule amine transporter-like isoform X1 [Branchiostoma floridae x Branchiostoma belcheri]
MEFHDHTTNSKNIWGEICDFMVCLTRFGSSIRRLVGRTEPIMPDYLYRLEHPNYTGAILSHHVNPAMLKLSTNIKTTTSCRGLETCSPAVHASEHSERAEALHKQSIRLGILYATKPAVSLVISPVVGLLADRLGYNIPLYLGILVVFASTIAFAFSRSYFALIISRVIQGVGAPLSTVAALVMVSAAFRDNAERAKNVGIVQTGMTFGIIVGPIIGGVMYQFFGYSSPFLLVAGMTIVDGFMRLLLPKEDASSNGDDRDYSYFNFVKDKYFMLTTVLIFMQTVTTLILWGIAPVWMMITMNAQPWQQGLGLLPYCVGFLMGAFTASKLVKKTGCWLGACIGFVGMGIFTTILPLCRSIPQMIAPFFFLGFARGITDTTLITETAHLADIRHDSKYGRAYAISETSINLGIVFGLGTSGVLLNALGFTWMMRTTGAVNILVGPLALLLRNPPSRPDKNKQTQSFSIPFQPKVDTLTYKPQPSLTCN